MFILALEWDDGNTGHIALHGVNPQEVEDVCFGPHFQRRAEDDRYVLAGHTAEGRYLTVVVERINGGRFRPVTAFDMSDAQKRQYRKRVGK